MKMIDLRSDTVTRPGRPMMQHMMSAEVGDDVFGDDPTVNQLEEYTAALFQKESALYCPSGTMANQIALKVHTRPGEEIICDRTAHVYNHEGGGVAFNSACSVRLIHGERGVFSAEDVRKNVNPDDVHYPRTRLVVIENTSNKGGGSCWPYSTMKNIKDQCGSLGLSVHLDGARVFNAIVTKKYKAEDIGQVADSISICLSKGLGAPVGSVLIGSHEFIREARRVRKVFGGGMRQAGYLAAAGLFALENNIERLEEDHRKAKVMAGVLAEAPYVSGIIPPETNILIFNTIEKYGADKILAWYKANGLYAVPFGENQIRFVFHLDISQSMLDRAIEVVRQPIPS